VVLLLLVIVAQLTLTLSRHPSLRLCHLVCVVGSRRIALVLVEALDVGRRVGAGAVVLADRVVALGAAHALLLEVGVWAGATSHHGHGLAAVGTHGRRREAGTEGLAALGKVLDGAVDLLKLRGKGIGDLAVDR